MQKIECLSQLEKNGTFKLTQDVILPDSYTPLKEFTGTLDGNNHTIYNASTQLINTIEKTLSLENLQTVHPYILFQSYQKLIQNSSY